MLDCTQKIAVIENEIFLSNQPITINKRSCSNIAYADKYCWYVAETVKKIVDNVLIDWSKMKDNVGIIFLNNLELQDTVSNVQNDLKRGIVSPLLFIASNAGSPISVVASMYGFHGPTINLTMPPENGTFISCLVASQWLYKSQADLVILSGLFLEKNIVYARSILLSKYHDDGEPQSLAQVSELFTASLFEHDYQDGMIL